MKRITVFLAVALLCIPASALAYPSFHLTGTIHSGEVLDYRYVTDELGREDAYMVNVDLSGLQFEINFINVPGYDKPVYKFEDISIPGYTIQAHDADFWPNMHGSYATFGCQFYDSPDWDFGIFGENSSSDFNTAFNYDGTGFIHAFFGDYSAAGVMSMHAEFTYSAMPVPEPATILLCTIGLVGIVSKRKLPKKTIRRYDS